MTGAEASIEEPATTGAEPDCTSGGTDTKSPSTAGDEQQPGQDPATEAPPPDEAQGPTATPNNESNPPAPLIDPDLVAKLAPVAVTAGTTALMMLPMLASALSGLGGGSTAPAAVAGSGMTPEAQRAMQVLNQLANAYGKGELTDPDAIRLLEERGLAGAGATAAALEAQQRFQNNRKAAFTAVDAQLADYLQSLAASSAENKKAITDIVAKVNQQLNDLGSGAYTQAGKAAVHTIIANALKSAMSIIEEGKSNSDEIVKKIDALTQIYLDSIAGKTTETGTRYALPARGTLTSPYGHRTDPTDQTVSDFHHGIDIANSIGTPVYAAVGGKVTAVGSDPAGGNYVKIEQSDGTTEIYYHLNSSSVEVGQQVSAGYQIATMGSTGSKVTGPHLHFEVRRNGQSINALDWLQQHGIQLSS
ncbi:peptidoglycan DD-metalloendopeptidase family protein [Nocardia sp. NPDC050793]|uniref:peptidoglycan DD-metalloendopeptidase family protein n=1 Tax=Nocardia sp. NPDC050793 TaxID=3155159 RepID=UPI0033FD5738